MMKVRVFAIVLALAASAPAVAQQYKPVPYHPPIPTPAMPAVPAPSLTPSTPTLTAPPAPVLQPIDPATPAPVVVPPQPPAEPAPETADGMSPCDCYVIETVPVMDGDRVTYQTKSRWTGTDTRCCPQR
ncbi:MAG: hypothetical protein ACKVP4_03045 [Hyphomicrobium sp.]